MFGIQNTGRFDMGKIPRMPRARHQDGWVEKTGKKTKTWTGYWYAYVKDGAGLESRKRRCKVVGKCAEMTKGQAEDALRLEIRGARRPAAHATFDDIARWYLKTNMGRWSKKWGVTVTAMFNHQVLPELGGRIAGDLKKSEIQQAINTIAAKPNSQSRSMVEKCLTHIRACYSLAIDDDLLERNPALKVEIPPTRRPSERFLSLEECQRLLAVADRRDRLIVRLFAVLGLRPGELFALRLNDLQPGSLRIDQTVVNYQIQDGAKTEGSLGMVPLPLDLEAELRAYVAEEKVTDVLFPSSAGKAYAPDNFLDRVLKRLGVLAQIDVVHKSIKMRNGRKKEVVTSLLNHQVLRRTTGTHFQKHGETSDVQTLLRHSNASTTLKHYIKNLRQSLIDGVESWDAQLVQKKTSTSSTQRIGSAGADQTGADQRRRR